MTALDFNLCQPLLCVRRVFLTSRGSQMSFGDGGKENASH